MRANVIVRSEVTQKIVQMVETSIDEKHVDEVVACLREAYPQGYKIDLEQIRLARVAYAMQ